MLSSFGTVDKFVKSCKIFWVAKASDFSLCDKVSKTAVKRSRRQGTLNFVSKNTMFGRLIDLLHVDLTSFLGMFQTSCCFRAKLARL